MLKKSILLVGVLSACVMCERGYGMETGGASSTSYTRTTVIPDIPYTPGMPARPDVPAVPADVPAKKLRIYSETAVRDGIAAARAYLVATSKGGKLKTVLTDLVRCADEMCAYQRNATNRKTAGYNASMISILLAFNDACSVFGDLFKSSEDKKMSFNGEDDTDQVNSFISILNERILPFIEAAAVVLRAALYTCETHLKSEPALTTTGEPALTTTGEPVKSGGVTTALKCLYNYDFELLLTQIINISRLLSGLTNSKEHGGLKYNLVLVVIALIFELYDVTIEGDSLGKTITDMATEVSTEFTGNPKNSAKLFAGAFLGLFTSKKESIAS